MIMVIKSMSARSVGTDLFIGTHVVDGDGAPLEGVRVRTRVDHHDGDFALANSKLTDELGDAEFRIGDAPSGVYTARPYQLIKAGYDWDMEQGVKAAEVAKS